MRYKLNDAYPLLRTPLGRSQFKFGIWHRLWPILSRLAYLYRRTVIRKTRIVAVAGSFGKSTTVRTVLKALGGEVHPSFDLNAYSSVARAILRTLPHDGHAVIEVGIDGPGQMAVYSRVIRPDIAVVTSIGSEHHRSLGSLDVTRHEKSEIVKALPKSGLAVLNGDDPNVSRMAQETSARVISFGLAKINDVRASDIVLDWPNGTKFKLHVKSEIRDVHIRFIGRHMVYPILASVAVSLFEGLTLDQVLTVLEEFPPTSGRLEPIQLKHGAYILRDEYKSTLETVHCALDVLSEIPAKRRIVVLGEVSEPPGSQGPIYRRIGEDIGQMASLAIFLGGNFQRYAAGATRMGMSRDALINARRSVSRAAYVVQQNLRPGDVVLIKGRDNQRLERIALSLLGRKVSCDISFCQAEVRCAHCPMLERGWNGLKVVI